jgi:hypothetical protein
MDLKDIIAYSFIGLGILGVAYFAWASRRKQGGQPASRGDQTNT